MKKTKKAICIILFLCLITCSSLPVNASTTEDSESIDLITRDCKTGELTYSTFKSKLPSSQNTKTNLSGNSLYNERTAAWFPEVKTNNTYPDNAVVPRKILGEDNRIKVTDTTQFPYSAICYMEVQFEKGDPICGTAFMISKNIALTAGHMLYNHELGGWAKKYKITPAKDGYGIWNNPYGTDADLTITASAKWVDEGVPSYDWGIIETGSNIGEKTGWLGIGWSSDSFVGTSVTISGYPHSTDPFYQYYMTGTITASTSLLLYSDNIDTTEGQSGSPIFTNDYTACGIYATGYSTDSSGPRITKSMYDLFVYCINNAA